MIDVRRYMYRLLLILGGEAGLDRVLESLVAEFERNYRYSHKSGHFRYILSIHSIVSRGFLTGTPVPAGRGAEKRDRIGSEG